METGFHNLNISVFTLHLYFFQSLYINSELISWLQWCISNSIIFLLNITAYSMITILIYYGIDVWINMNEWCIYIALFVYCCTPKALYNHVGGSLLNHHQCAASTWMMRRLPQDNTPPPPRHVSGNTIYTLLLYIVSLDTRTQSCLSLALASSFSTFFVVWQ